MVDLVAHATAAEVAAEAAGEEPLGKRLMEFARDPLRGRASAREREMYSPSDTDSRDSGTARSPRR